METQKDGVKTAKQYMWFVANTVNVTIGSTNRSVCVCPSTPSFTRMPQRMDRNEGHEMQSALTTHLLQVRGWLLIVI